MMTPAKWFTNVALLVILAQGAAGCCGPLRVIDSAAVKVCKGKGASETLPVPPREQLSGQIVFISDRDEADGEVYSMSADGSRVKRLTRDHLAEEYPSLSPDGSQIAFSLRTGGIYVLDLRSCGPAGDCGESDVRRVYEYGSRPKWSPDGQHILFVFEDAMVMNADGSGVTALEVRPATPGRVEEAGWAPDGRGIATVSMQMVTNLYLVRFGDGWRWSEMTWLARGGYQPAVAPDGSRVVFRYDGPCLCLVPADGKQSPQRLTAFAASSPTWSPDGRWIAFVHAGHIGILDAQGKYLLYITQGPCQDAMPAWYP